MPRQAVTDPELLRMLESSPGAAPVTAAAAPTRRAVTDPSLLSQLESATPVQTSALAEPSPLERTATRMQSALAEADRIVQPGAMERMGKEGFVPSVASRPEPSVLSRMPGVVARGTKLAYQKHGSALRQVLEDEKAWLAQKAAESHAAGGYGMTPEQTQAAIEKDLARGGMAEVRSASASRATRRLSAAMKENIPKDAGFIERNIEEGLISSAETLPTVAIGALVPGAQVPALVALSGQAAAGRYAELVAQGVDPGEAAKSAMLLGPLEGLTEKIPLGTLAKRSPAVKKLFEFLVTDLVGEEVSTVAQLADDYRLGLADDVTAADVKQAMLDTAAQTAVGATVQVGGVELIQSIVDRANEFAKARAPKIEAPSDEEIQRNIGALDDESLTDEQLDQQIEELERELAGESETPAPAPAPAKTGTLADVIGEAPRPPEEVPPDLIAEFGTEELKNVGPIPEDQVAIVPADRMPGAYAVMVNGREHVIVPSLEQAEAISADLIRGPKEQAEPAPAEPAAPLSLEERLTKDVALRRSLEFMANEAGWLEKGGRLIRGSEDPSDPNYNTIVGRTRWIPRADWWPDRPKGFNEEKVRATVAKALDGEPLTKPERRLIEFMAEVSDQRAKLDEFMPQADELPESEQNLDSAFETAMVARAIEIDEDLVERLAIRYDSDHNGFLKAIKAFLDGHDDRRLLEGGAQGEGAASQAVKEEEGRQAGQALGVEDRRSLDLFGQDTSRQQELADEIRRRDAKRSPNKDVPLETGDPTDLFSQARRQVDLEDLAPPARKEPTPAQIAAGNYPKIHKRIHGLELSIENDVGSTRIYTNPDGTKGERIMKDPYGYIRGYKGNTGEHVDVFVGPHEDSDRAFVIDQVIDGKFDEPKTLVGYRTKEEARTAYLRNYQSGWKGLGAITELSIPEFKQWLESGGPKKPLAWKPPKEEKQHPRLERLERLKALRAQRHAIQAGANYVPLYQGGQVMPLTATTVTIGTGAGARTVPIPTTPIRREHIMAQLQRDFGVKVYQGKPFRGRMLGFFRPSNFEVRIKHKNDLEVTAHEIFHWLDETYPELNRLYHQKQFDKELRSISYDAKKLHEGFAEFGRLFLTQDAQAAQKTPNFHAAFVTKAHELGIYERLAKIQERMHQWYMQGALARARSKVGHEAEPLAQRMTALADVWSDRAMAESVDHLHAAKVIERTLTGTIAADAMQSPYKSLRLLAGARNTIEAFLNYGTLNWTPQGLEFTGKSLKHVFEPVANYMEETLSYFIGRRAEELMKYGKERLFTKDEIGAMLDAGRNSPKAKEIEHAFNEYQAYVDRLMDFADASGIVSGATRALWKSLYQNYVPFYRVSETLGSMRLSGPTIQNPFKKLFGGTANLNDIWDNMVMNTATVVHASLRNMAKRQLFDAIEKSPIGQRFAVRIPTHTETVKVAMQQVEQVLRGLVDEAEQRALDPNATAAEKAHYAQVWQALDTLTSATNPAGGSALDAMQQQATFYVGGQPPTIPDKDSILVNGERVWFQIADPLMWDMLSDINYHKPIGLLEVVFGVFKRTLTRGVTITPEFQFANIIRDTLDAATMSRGGQVPMVHAVRAMGDIILRNENYKLFLANGGGFGNATPVNEGRRVRMQMRKLYQGGRVNIRAILDTPRKLLDFWDRWGQAFELGTRLAEFKLVRKKGGSLREAAFQGREISSDFAMHGRARAMRAAMISLPFFNARLQSLYRLERELFERGGRQSWHGERQLQYAMRGLIGITVPSLILYFWNKDDEDYQALSDETRYQYYPIKLPGTHDFVLIPKPFETGALFSTVPEQLWQYAETKNERKLMDAAAFTLINTFAFDPIPQVGRPAVEWYANKDWRGLPVVPRSLENVEPREQYRWNTSPTLVEIGKRFDVSPIALDHFLRGYFGGLSDYLTMASDSLVTSKQWGEDPTRRLSQYPVVRRFLREAPYTNTSYQREFWDLAREVDRTVNTARKIREEYRQDDLEAYLGDSEKVVLFSLKEVSDRIAERARQISAAQIRIRRDPQMPGDEKRRQIDELQQELNGLFREAVKQLDREQLEQYRDALEGRQPQASSRQVFDSIAPLIEGKPRRQQVASLKAAGYAELAGLIASLPPTPDKEALGLFEALGEPS